MSTPLRRDERDALTRELQEIDRALYPEKNADAPKGREAKRLEERYYQLLGEYGDRLPRVVMGASPFNGEKLKQSFDPFDLAGPWWFMDRTFEIDEPALPADFQVLLGAFALHGRVPKETTAPLIPGPEVPFVVPSLLNLPGMVAVISRLDLATGDTAYPISYWSQEPIRPQQLHQPWLRQELWIDDGNGGKSWLIANDTWDFDLGPWIEVGKLLWIQPGDTEYRVVGGKNPSQCPYLNLPGDRQPQSIAGGERDLTDLPDGRQLNPFDE